ncbi:hypothetical protein Tco_0459278 [Tanacetum coccineum]
MEQELDDDNNHEYRIAVYEPMSGLSSGGINGKQRTFSARFRDQAVGNVGERGSLPLKLELNVDKFGHLCALSKLLQTTVVLHLNSTGNKVP